MKSIQNPFRTRTLGSIVLGLVALTAAALVLPNPDLTYTTTTRIELSGALGRAVNMLSRLGGGSNEITETVYLRGNTMRRDTDQQSTIIDLDGERYITLDNRNKTYSVITFAEFQQQMEEMVREAEEGAQQAGQDAGHAPAQSDVDVSFDIKVDRTGKKQTIQGFNTEQVFMTVSAKFSDKTADASGGPSEGTLVIAMELWMANQLDAFDEETAFYQRMGERMGQSMLQSGQNLYASMGQIMAQHPGMAEGLEKAAEEASKLEGREVKSTTRVVMVPQGVTFTPAMAFAEPEEKPAEPKSGRARGLARGLLKQAIGAGNANEPQDENTPAKPATIMTITTELSSYQTAPIAPSIFEIPSDYRQVESPFGSR